MKLKTSFFNGALLRKDMARFMPLWAVYTIGLVMFQMVSLRVNSESGFRAYDMASYYIQGLVIPTFLYAGICAVTLFGDLYIPRMCNALHALPMRREGWFITHTVAGLLFGLIPTLLAALVSLPLLESYYYVVLIWLGAVTLQYIFFFGLAVLCVMCAGNRLGMVASYGIANFFSIFIYSLVQTFYVPMLYGVEMKFDPFKFLCPVMQLFSQNMMVTEWPSKSEQFAISAFVPSSWAYLFGLAVLGIVFAVLAVIVYRRRALERAGDFLAVHAIAPVFLMIVTLGTGMMFYLFTQLFHSKGIYPFLFVGMGVGYFVGKMLLERSVRVFQIKSVLGYVLIAALMGTSLIITQIDPIGIVTRVPAEDQILFCALTTPYPDRIREVCDPAEIHQITEFHKELCRSRPDKHNSSESDVSIVDRDAQTFPVRIIYKLTSGSYMERVYQVSSGNETGKQIMKYMNQWQNVLGTDNLEELASKIRYGRFTVWNLNYGSAEYEIENEDIMPILNAIRMDAEVGNFYTHQFVPENRHISASLHLEISNSNTEEGRNDWIRLEINDDCKNVLDVLRDLSNHKNPIQ